MGKGWKRSWVLDCIPGDEENCVLGGTDTIIPSFPPSPQATHVLSPALQSELDLALSLVHFDLPSPLLSLEIFSQAQISSWAHYGNHQPSSLRFLPVNLSPFSDTALLSGLYRCPCSVSHQCPKIFLSFCLFSWFLLQSGYQLWNKMAFPLIFTSLSVVISYPSLPFHSKLSCFLSLSHTLYQPYHNFSSSLSSSFDILDNSSISKP